MIKKTNSIMRKWATRTLALAMLPCFAMSAIADDDKEDQQPEPEEQPQPLARFSPDHKQILVNAPGVKEFSFGTSVRALVDGQHTSISSDLDSVESVSEWRDLDTPMGLAMAKSVTYQKPGGELAYTITLKILKESKTIALEGVFHNRSSKNANLNYIELLSTYSGGRFVVDAPNQWLVTPLMEDKPAEMMNSLQTSFREAVLIYNKGAGFLIGPTGPPEAYTEIDFREGGFKAYAKMEGVLVRAGESRRGEPMMVCFDSPATATNIWTRWVAATHGARLHRGPVYGWCSWYDRTTKIDEKHTREVLDILASNPNVFGKGVLQIDDGYQIMDGDWRGNAKFPSGMATMAKDIRAKGWLPGVWFAPLMINPEHPWMKENPEAIQKNADGIASFMNANPFHPDGANWIVPDHPESKKFLYNIIKDARDRGYGYIKIDFNGIGSRFTDPSKTSLQIFRDLYTLYREAAGEEMYILSCLGQPTRGVIGFIDAARVGPDSHPAHFDKCLKSVLRFQIYDNVWWQNDPDVSYIATELPSRELGCVRGGENSEAPHEGMWRTWHAITTLVGGTAMISEPLQTEDSKAAWRAFEIMRPASAEPARLWTLGTSAGNGIFGFSAQRPFGDFSVFNLYNSSKGQQAINLNFASVGVPPGVECAVFDFWENKVVARAKDSYTTAPLEYLSSALLRFTPLNSDRPLLVGSNLHLSIGATEIKDIRTSPERVEVLLTDAGAQDGSLTFHSAKPLAAEGAENCEVTAVESLGENLWRVDLKGRQWGKPQSIRLSIGAAKPKAAK
jgi:hypothetical protein